jgi:hypothetical protein
MVLPARTPPAEPVFPALHEPWFRDLPEQRRAELESEWRAQQQRVVELVERMRRRTVVETVKMAAVFVVGDLACPWGSFVTVLVLAACGALWGWISHRADLGQVRTGAIGLAIFFLAQLVTRDGLAALHMLACFPVGCACAYLGWRRSEREFD